MKPSRRDVIDSLFRIDQKVAIFEERARVSPDVDADDYDQIACVCTRITEMLDFLYAQLVK